MSPPGLHRMVTNHGFLGAMIHGHIRGRYLDHQFFWPVFEMAEKLDVPCCMRSDSTESCSQSTILTAERLLKFTPGSLRATSEIARKRN
jgi:predicted TIM-barrel fold metal-dependent hydrolase